jgi:RNA polymerase sigma factor (sigma-70 family)
MVALVRILPGFRYDPALGRFRNFLLTIVHRKALAALRRAARRPSISLDAEGQDGGTPLVDRLPAPPAAEPGAADRERWRQAIVEKALGELRSNPDIGERTLAVFEAYVIRSRPCAEVAATFGIKENAVYQIRNRLLRQLQVAVRRLAEDADPAGLPPPA